MWLLFAYPAAAPCACSAKAFLPKIMILSYFTPDEQTIYVVAHVTPLLPEWQERLAWLFKLPSAAQQPLQQVAGVFVGPRREMISPWSTNAVEITQNMGLEGIERIEMLQRVADERAPYDAKLQELYTDPDQKAFEAHRVKEPIRPISDIAAYNAAEGLALSREEIAFLEALSKKLGRPLTDSELFGFSQVNSEHCRHKIFNGEFVLDGETMPSSLFQLIKSTSQENPGTIVSAYKDNVAFVAGPRVEQFAPTRGDAPSFYAAKPIDSVLSLKAETHNFPTTVEPFNGAATGTGGEIRDRMAGGKGSIPVAGTAVYITSNPRLGLQHPPLAARKWLYQTPREILTKASDGASDFGNKFGQPIITGSLLTFEHQENPEAPMYGFDKVIMLAGGIGYAQGRDAQKCTPKGGETVVMMGGDNYRIGMGGGAVSSVETGRYATGIELNAVQRANPEMQKRVQNVVRSLAESDDNPILSIHDHGAGGHLNCLTELIEETGGTIDVDALPVGDSTLSVREIIGNESQERMGLLIDDKDYERVAAIARRERAPIYKVGRTEATGKLRFACQDGTEAVNLAVEDMLAKPPKTVMHDSRVEHHYADAPYDECDPIRYLHAVLQLEAVGAKDWLTNKVDRSVTGKIARQQCCGPLQLPLADLGAIALDRRGEKGMATSIGHAPQSGLISAAKGSELSIAEALTNIVFAPLEEGLSSVSLSANWMWPCRNAGEDCRLYEAVEACSRLAIDLGINIPTGKDSLSMTQKYPDGKQVLSPGTVIISAAGAVKDVRKIVSPDLKLRPDTHIVYIDFSFDSQKLGGSALMQTLGALGSEAPTVANPEYFAEAFNAVQQLIDRGWVLAGHDISSGGLLVALLEMAFPRPSAGMKLDLGELPEQDLVKLLYAENPGVLLQTDHIGELVALLDEYAIGYAVLGKVTTDGKLALKKGDFSAEIDVAEARTAWFAPSAAMEKYQVPLEQAEQRAANMDALPLQHSFPADFSGWLSDWGLEHGRTERSGVIAAVVRDKGTNGEREMAYALHLAGFDVRDVHLTDLTSGRETLDDVQLLVFAGGFSNSDVLGSARGWAAGIRYNERAKAAIERFYARPDTISLGVCNGCQLMAELGLLYTDTVPRHTMEHNLSHKYESCFVSLEIPKSPSILLQGLEGSKLGIWCAHGEGRFFFPTQQPELPVAARYLYDQYPANPNGSPDAVAALCSSDGRHLAMMPHPERAIFPWQCGDYPQEHRMEDVTPWLKLFRNGYLWAKAHKA